MNGDGPDVEYAGTNPFGDLTAWKSLAAHLSKSVFEVVQMADNNTLADAIKARNALIPAELRSPGYTTCAGCGGAVRHRFRCACGEIAPGRERLDGRAARDLLWQRRAAPE